VSYDKLTETFTSIPWTAMGREAIWYFGELKKVFTGIGWLCMGFKLNPSTSSISTFAQTPNISYIRPVNFLLSTHVSPAK
jgi:hypothetical protein